MAALPIWLKARTRGKPAATADEDLAAQAAAVAAYNARKAKGHSKDDASKKVAERMVERNYHLPGQYSELTGTTIINWSRRRETSLADYKHIWSGAGLRKMEELKGAPLTDDEILLAVEAGLLQR